ncbi:MAG: hypothetical protein N3A60_04180 [Thermanaerothrix sp.]|uniref:Type II secretion system protein GspF domain-containing protein n=1 Tax=Thermanaerothrix solaris TaxID=3058434 RepID=A0ABU3NS02_9CHLR|nr:hypothetical protein [Thermanaerothrix sp. 4228-RoL]MCX8024381.1 hypothetical protein [Thermanaerothrix sp.]MDT8899599.1 hypothetical protein [Thermanaerothrix sp. 4228-RoL]
MSFVVLIAFVGATAAMVFGYELLQRALAPTYAQHRLQGPTVGAVESARQPSLWEAVLVAVFPGWFGQGISKRSETLVDLLRRAGYPYSSPGEFYAHAIRIFAQNLVVLGALSAVLILVGVPEGILPIGALLVYDGLQRPYRRLRRMIRQRAQAFRNNMLAGLSTLQSLMAAGIGVQEAMRRTAEIGGPFCNLLLLLVTRMEIEPFSDALEAVRRHLPDPNDVEVNLFLRDVEAYFTTNRPLLPGVVALQNAVHRLMVEETESRAAMVRQRANLFGIFGVVGMLLTLILPFMMLL